MQKRHFEMETDGFYGAYWKCKTDSDCAMIAMIGDDSEDYLARTSVKWLHKLGVNVMTMSPARKYPKECQTARLDIDQRVRNAVAEWKSTER